MTGQAIGIGDALIDELRDRRLALASLVLRVTMNKRAFAIVAAEAHARWQRTEPASWMRVERWLSEQGVDMIFV